MYSNINTDTLMIYTVFPRMNRVKVWSKCSHYVV